VYGPWNEYDTAREMYFPPCGGHGPAGEGAEGSVAASALLLYRKAGIE